MVPASLAAMVTCQTTAELDVSRRRIQLVNAQVKEKSITLTEQHVLLVSLTQELKDKTLYALLINATQTKLSLGWEHALIAWLVKARLTHTPVVDLLEPD